MYSHIQAIPELRSVERTSCLHPSDRMSSYRTPCSPTDTRLAPTCCATPTACGLCSAVRKLLPMVRILPKTKLYDIWNGQLPGGYTTRSVQDHLPSVQMAGRDVTKRSHTVQVAMAGVSMGQEHDIAFGSFRLEMPLGRLRRRLVQLSSNNFTFRHRAVSVVAPQLTVVTRTIARSGVAMFVKDAHAASVVPREAAAPEMPGMRASSSNGR